MPTPTQPLQTSNSPQLRSPGTPTQKERERDAIISAASRGWSNRSAPSSKIALKAHSVMSPNAEFSPNRLFKQENSAKHPPVSRLGAGVESTQRRTSSSFSHVRNNSLVQNSPFKQHHEDVPSPSIDYSASPKPAASPGMGLGLHPSRSPHRHTQPQETSIPKPKPPRKSKGYNLLPSAQRVTQSPWRVRDTSNSSAGSEAENIDEHPASAFSPPTPQPTHQTQPLSVSKKIDEERESDEQERPQSAGSTLSRRKTVTFEDSPSVHEFEREPELDSIATGVFSPEYDDEYNSYDEVEIDEQDIDLYDAQNAQDALVGASWEDTPPMPPSSTSLVDQHTLNKNRPTPESLENTPELAEDYAHEGILEEYSHEYPHEYNDTELEVDTSYQSAYPDESASYYEDDDHYDDNSSVIDHTFDEDQYEHSQDPERTQMEDLVDSILRDELLRDSERRKSLEDPKYASTSPLRTSTNKRQSTPVKETTPSKMRELGLGRPQSMPSPNLSLEYTSQDMVRDDPIVEPKQPEKQEEEHPVELEGQKEEDHSVEFEEQKQNLSGEHEQSDDDIRDRSVLPELPHSSPLWALSPPAEEVAKMPRLSYAERLSYGEQVHPPPEQPDAEKENTPNIDSLISPLLSPRLDAAGNPLSPNAAGSVTRRRNLREAVQEKMRKKREAEEANAALLAEREKESNKEVFTPKILSPEVDELQESQPPSPVKAAIAAVAPSPMKSGREDVFDNTPASSSVPQAPQQEKEPEHEPEPEPESAPAPAPVSIEEETTADLEGFAPFVSPNLEDATLQRQMSLRGNASLQDRENAILLSRRKSRADKGERPSRRRSVSADATETPRRKAVYRPSSGLPTPGALTESDFGHDLDLEMREIFKDSDRKYRLFEHDEVIRATSSEEQAQKPKISHSTKAGDIDSGKAWKVIKRPSDMNEYASHLKDIRGKEAFSEATGKVFVKVVGLRDVELPIPVAKQTYFCCTLDNGINHVATPYTVLKKEAPLGQEFDLILNKNLFFTLSFKCRMDEHLAPPRPPRFRPAMVTPTQPPPSPSKSSLGFRSLFSSPRKEKKKAQQEQQQQLEREIASSKLEELEPVMPTEPMLNFLQKDGSFGSTRVIYNEVAHRCQGRMVELILPLEGKFTKNDGSVTKCIVGKLVLHMLGIPNLPGVTQKDLPMSLDHTLKVMKEMQWHKKKVCQSVLTQLGGGVTSWRRRMYSLVGGRIIVFNEITKRAIATIDLQTAVTVEDANNASEEAVEKGWVDEGDASVERSFILVLKVDEVEEKLHFFGDTDDDKDIWIKELSGIIGRIPPKPLWAQALEERQSPPPSQLPQRTTSNVTSSQQAPQMARQTLSPIKASPIPSAHALYTSTNRRPPPAPSAGMAHPGLMASLASRQDSLPTPTKNQKGPVSVQSSTKGVNQSTYDKKSLRGSIFSSIGSRSATPSRSYTPDTSFRSTTKSFFGFK